MHRSTFLYDRRKRNPNNIAPLKLLTDGFYNFGNSFRCGRFWCGYTNTIIKKGRAMHFGNLDKSWKGTQVDKLFEQHSNNPFFVVNDADAAAMGVMEFGVGKAEKGLVITITLGTGIGSGVFFNGELLSNFELGRLYGKKGDIMELFASDAARKRNDWDFKKWGKRLNFFLSHIEKSFNPDLIIIGGGVSKKIDHFKRYIDIETPFKSAELKNNAGIVGAALFAKRSSL